MRLVNIWVSYLLIYFTEVITQQVELRKFDFPVERALFAMVANRACAPSSKLYCYEQWLKEDVHLAGI